MSQTPSARKPLPRLDPEVRRKLLAERGLDENMVPFNATYEERIAAMSDIPVNPVIQNATFNVTGQPAQGAIIKQGAVRLLAGVGVVCAAALAASEAGVLPSWVGPVAQAVIGLLAAVGIASPGVRKV